MENFLKITNLFKELNDELATLKKDLEADINYSVSHAEIVTNVENAEESLLDVENQLREIEQDVDELNNTLEEQMLKDTDDEDDERETRMYSRISDDDE